MSTTLPIRCTCGALRGIARDIAPDRVNRVVCHCRGCTAAAHALRPQNPDDILDEHGGTHRVQISPANIEITHGKEHLALTRMTPKGALRWYAECCNTPLALTFAKRGVFVGVELVCLDTTEPEEHLGPVHARVNGSFPREERVALAATFGSLLRMLWRLILLMLRWRWRGDHERSPFFDPDTGQPLRSVKALPATASPRTPA